MRRSSIVALSLLGVGGTALAASAFTGGSCERAYPTLDQCVAQHGNASCTSTTRDGPDGKPTTVFLGPNRSCSAWNHGGLFFMPGYWGGYGYYGGGYHPGYYAPGSTTRSPVGTPGSSIGGGSTRGGFGGTGSSFSSGS